VDKDDFPVVCLGGSAGALEAYTDILCNMPTDTGMAFVIVAHRSIHTVTRWLRLILADITAIPVIEVEDGMLLEPNRVYLMPPGKDMRVNIDKFTLRPSLKPRGWPITITLFLRSLGEAYGPRTIAVILSGMSQDGSAALRDIKAAGGRTFAQSNAEFGDMPRHAVETGYVDFMLSPTEIAQALLQVCGSAEVAPIPMRFATIR
jgi:chemotaxis response regulator CheB